jgi:hypothetical protein
MIKMSIYSPGVVLVSEINGISTDFKFPLKKMYRDYDIRRYNPWKPKGTHKASLCRSITGLGRGKQEPFKEFVDTYNITFNNLLKHVRGFAYAELVQPFEHLINSMCRSHSKGCYNWYTISILNNRKKAITTLKEDGLYHLTPLVKFLEEDTNQPCKVLKEKTGKSKWKELCKNSFTRNCLVAKVNDYEYVSYGITTGPSMLMKYGSVELVRAYSLATKYSDLRWFKVSDYKNYGELYRYFTLISDSIKIYKLISRIRDKEVNEKSLKKKLYNMTPEELKVYHDNLALEYEELRDQAAKEPIEWVVNTFELSGEVLGTPYKILQSPLEIREEGRNMHHCVGMYDSRVLDKEYLVVSVDPDSKEPSTLGLRVAYDDGKMVLKFNQHYYACNKPVDVERESVGYEIIKKLNKEIE